MEDKGGSEGEAPARGLLRVWVKPRFPGELGSVPPGPACAESPIRRLRIIKELTPVLFVVTGTGAISILSLVGRSADSLPLRLCLPFRLPGSRLRFPLLLSVKFEPREPGLTVGGQGGVSGVFSGWLVVRGSVSAWSVQCSETGGVSRVV